MKQNADGYYSKSLYITQTNGKRKEIRIRGKSPEEVEEKYRLKKLEYEKGLITVNSNTSFCRWVEEWLEVYKKPKVTTGTYEEIKGIMERCFVCHIGNMKISEIKLPHVQRCLNLLEGKSKSYIHRAYIYIKACFQKAWEAEMINRSPCIGLIEPNAAPKIDRRPLTPEERRFFMKAIQTHHKGAFFGILYACGLRPAEARALTWFNVNIANKAITITQSVAEKTNEIKAPKTEAGKRTVPVPDWYMKMLQEIPRTDSPYVFPNQKGKPMDEQRYIKAWKSLLREMDLLAGAQTYRNKIIIHSDAIGQDLTPYNLRHTYATELAEKGVPLKTAQYLLGHSDIRVTANIYTHITKTIIEEAREKING